MKVVWTPRALARVRQIHAYIAKEHPPNANQMVDRLTTPVAQLSDHPLSGRVVEFFQRKALRVRLVVLSVARHVACMAASLPPVR